MQEEVAEDQDEEDGDGEEGDHPRKEEEREEGRPEEDEPGQPDEPPSSRGFVEALVVLVAAVTVAGPVDVDLEEPHPPGEPARGERPFDLGPEPDEQLVLRLRVGRDVGRGDALGSRPLEQSVVIVTDLDLVMDERSVLEEVRLLLVGGSEEADLLLERGPESPVDLAPRGDRPRRIVGLETERILRLEAEDPVGDAYSAPPGTFQSRT